jgi:hypothetical protein
VKQRLKNEQLIAAKRKNMEKFSAVKFKLSMRKIIAPKKREAPLKSICRREGTFESSSKIIIKTIRVIPMGKLI